MSEPFAICSSCKHEWESLDQFMNDDFVSLVGYQVNFDHLEAGFFLFNHSCGTTFGVDVHKFRELHTGPVYKVKATGTESCPEYCLKKGILDPCPASCECAFVREILQKLKRNTEGRTN